MTDNAGHQDVGGAVLVDPTKMMLIVLVDEEGKTSVATPSLTTRQVAVALTKMAEEFHSRADQAGEPKMDVGDAKFVYRGRSTRPFGETIGGEG